MALITATETELPRLSDLLKYEVNPALCRESVTLTAAAVVAGAVLGRTTATGAYKAHDPIATDGSEVARAVALFDAPASGACIALRRSGVVALQSLVFKAGMTAAQQTTALTQLADAGIVALTAV